jgi:hypothetical protein
MRHMSYQGFVPALNLTLLRKQAEQWVYRCPEQQTLVQACEDILQWKLYAFDCWLYDDANWSMYTSGRQRMIASREEVARLYPAVREDRLEATLLLAAHCAMAWRCTRKARLAPHPAITDMEQAYARARLIKRPAAPKSGKPSHSIAPGVAAYGHLVVSQPPTDAAGAPRGCALQSWD